MFDFQCFSDKVCVFVEVCDWDQFYLFKNLIMVLGGEVFELLDLFQWLMEVQFYELLLEQQCVVVYEIVDVQIYLLRLVDKLGVDIFSVVEEKMVINEVCYFVDQVCGLVCKYIVYQNKDDDGL